MICNLFLFCFFLRCRTFFFTLVMLHDDLTISLWPSITAFIVDNFRSFLLMLILTISVWWFSNQMFYAIFSWRFVQNDRLNEWNQKKKRTCDCNHQNNLCWDNKVCLFEKHTEWDTYVCIYPSIDLCPAMRCSFYCILVIMTFWARHMLCFFMCFCFIESNLCERARTHTPTEWPILVFFFHPNATQN